MNTRLKNVVYGISIAGMLITASSVDNSSIAVIATSIAVFAIGIFVASKL